MGLLMMVSLLPSVILGPLGGTIADRHPRVRIIGATVRRQRQSGRAIKRET